MSNKTDGTLYEEYCASRLSDKGFWVHLLQQNKSGQPADIIAVNQHGAFLIDAKRCAGHLFPLRRVEYNQALAMSKWMMKANENAYFFIGFEEGESSYAVKYSDIAMLMTYGHKSITEDECKNIGTELGEWLNRWSW